MIIIPIGHESDEVRRLPWITFGIMALCVIFHIFISSQMSKATKGLESSAEELVHYYFDHPYLELDTETLKLMFGNRGSQKVQEMLSVYRYNVPPPSRSEYIPSRFTRAGQDLSGAQPRCGRAGCQTLPPTP